MSPSSRNSVAGPLLHRAGWVLTDPDTLLENGWVLAASGVIQAVGNGRRPTAEQVIDHGPGVLMPALVNAHTHLELTALKDKVPVGGGFAAWVHRLLKEREAAGTDALTAGVSDGIAQLTASGCGLVGDISSLGLSWAPLLASEMDGIFFRERLGNHPPGNHPPGNYPIDEPDFRTAHDGRLHASVAGHAPHTTAPAVLTALKTAALRNGLPFSIHLDESDAERTFIAMGKGTWANFLTQRAIPFAGWGLPADSPVDHADRLGLLDNLTIAVHLIGAGPGEFDLLKQRGVHICLCPRSNWRLHRRLPDLEGMLTAGLAPCLGTDSLASTPSLSILDEMAFVRRRFPNIPPEQILAMATANGSKALGMAAHYGTLAPGKQARFVYVDAGGGKQNTLLEMILNWTTDHPQGDARARLI